MRDYVIAIFAAIGVVSAIVSLLTTKWSEVTGAARLRRTTLVATLALAAITAGIVSMPSKKPAIAPGHPAPPDRASAISARASTLEPQVTGANRGARSIDAALATLVYVTPSGKKYHRSTCRYVKNNAGAFALPLDDALRAHTPCSICDPPRQEK